MAWLIPLVIMGMAFASDISGVYTGPWLFIFSVAVFGVPFFWFQSWPCPRCGRPFTEPKRDLTYSQRCHHCGLGLWKEPGDVVTYRRKQQHSGVFMFEITPEDLATLNEFWECALTGSRPSQAA
jgi:endogenous inhibitor of DNA gyrase (YacG/DUF329 family)